MSPFSRLICLVFLTSVAFTVQAASVQRKKANMTIHLRNANLTESIRMVASMLDMKVIISPAVTGHVTLSMSNASPGEILSALLYAYGLARLPIGQVWLIAPRTDLLKRVQNEYKLNELENDSEPLSMRIWQVRYASARDIGHILQDEHSSLLSKRGRIWIDSRTNQICALEGESRLRSIQVMIKRFDVPIHQVTIKARLVSIDSDYERELGVNFSMHTQQKTVREHDTEEDALKVEEIRALASVSALHGSNLDIKLSALERAGHAELISSPSLFTSDQQEAWIEAGEEVPYQESSDGGGTATVFKKAVLRLKVTPRILPGNKILLHLEINQDRPGSRQVQGVPMINTRKMMTQVLAADKETIVLGGIFEETRDQDYSGVPFFHKIPFLGEIFKTRYRHNSKRELLIFVTPIIMSGTVN